MRSSRLRGLGLFGFWAVSLLFPPFLLSAQTESEEALATRRLQVTLSGIASYREFQEIRAALSRAEGVEKVSIEAEAPGLITLGLRYAGKPKGLIEKLNLFFAERFTLQEKHLSSRATEIVITPKGP